MPQWLQLLNHAAVWYYQSDDGTTLGRTQETLRGVLAWDSTRPNVMPGLPETPIGRYPDVDTAKAAVETRFPLESK